MLECVLVPTFNRVELLWGCLKRIRTIEPDIHIEVFPDRGTICDPLVQKTLAEFGAHGQLVPDNSWYGNSSNSMNSFLWAYNSGFDRAFYIEGDVFPHNDFFSWHREMQEELPDIFASMAWVFNRYAPLSDDPMFQPWIYAIGDCFSRKSLELIVPHATPLYYEDMVGYVRKRFKNCPLNDPQNLNHWEFDGVLQRILMEHKLQTVSCGIAKCSHMGFVRSYGDDGALSFYEEMLDSAHLNFAQRIERVEELYSDHYWRARIFGREIVEREIGRELPKREFRYRVQLEGGWSCDFVSELQQRQLPRRLFSVPLPPTAKFVLL